VPTEYVVVALAAAAAAGAAAPEQQLPPLPLRLLRVAALAAPVCNASELRERAKCVCWYECMCMCVRV